MLIAHFAPKPFSTTTYAEAVRRLDKAGAGAPAGRLHHAAYGDADGLRIVDVFDTQENFDAFGSTLVPILKDLGVDVGAPLIEHVHNVIKG